MRRKSDVNRILFLRDQDDTYFYEELYALFADFTPGEIADIRNALVEGQWQFMDKQERMEFLISYYIANKQPDTEWIQHPTISFDSYLGASFSKKHFIKQLCKTDYRNAGCKGCSCTLKSFSKMSSGTEIFNSRFRFFFD